MVRSFSRIAGTSGKVRIERGETSKMGQETIEALQELVDHAEGIITLRTSRLKYAPDGTVIGVEYIDEETGEPEKTKPER